MRVMEVSTVVQSLLVFKRPDQIQTASKRVSVHPSSRADCPLKGNLSVQQASHTPFKHLKLQTDTSRLESINRLTERVDQKGPTRLTRLRSFTTLRCLVSKCYRQTLYLNGSSRATLNSSTHTSSLTLERTQSPPRTDAAIAAEETLQRNTMRAVAARRMVGCSAASISACLKPVATPL